MHRQIPGIGKAFNAVMKHVFRADNLGNFMNDIHGIISCSWVLLKQWERQICPAKKAKNSTAMEDNVAIK